jgi:uncharacterized membrane protein YfcA
MDGTTLYVVIVVFLATLYWFAGLWAPAVTHFYLISLPATLPAIWLGRPVNHRLREETYLKYVYSALAGIAAVLLIQAMTK